MKLKIEYSGFCMRKNTEFVNRTKGSELFFKEMQIPFVIETVGDREVLSYEEYTKVDVPWYSEHMYMDMAERYNCEFVIKPKTITIKFN